jgi:hypothetical protein
MGLLDDAIREHLELKRLSGADPGVVAREEHDALGRVRRRGEEEHSPQGEDGEAKVPPSADGSFSSDPEPDPATDFSTGGQETVEINMEAELEAGAEPGREPESARPERAAPMPHPADAQSSAGDSLEWEVPSDRPSEPSGDLGSDDKDGSRPEDGHDTGEHVEDVLEETPDFLRDTPEQERLWFEQRPPRDFDFNE